MTTTAAATSAGRTSRSEVNAYIPEAYVPLFQRDIEKYKYIVIYSGRWAGKTWQVALSLVLRMIREPIRVVCAREYQNRLDDTVYARIVSTINDLGYDSLFTLIPSKSKIKCVNGGEFIFRGLKNEGALNSIDNISVLWIDEAQFITEKSLQYAMPSVRGQRHIGRKPRISNTQFIFTLNPYLSTDPVYSQFIMGQIPAKHLILKTSWRDMAALDKAIGVIDEEGKPAFEGEYERQRSLLNDPPAVYRWIWEAETITSGTAILAGIQKTDILPSSGGVLFIDPAYGGEDSTALTFASHRGDVTIVCGFNFKGGADGGAWYEYLDKGIIGALKDLFQPNKTYIETFNAKNEEPLRVLRKAGMRGRGWYSNMPKKKRISLLGAHANWILLSEVVFNGQPIVNEANERYNAEVLGYTEEAEHDDAPDSLTSAMACLRIVKIDNEHK